MAQAMTFTSLKEDIRRYLERGSPPDTQVFEQIPRLIALAERAIAEDLKIQGFIEVLTQNLQPGVSVYQKPDRWRDTVSMQFGTGLTLNTRTPLFARAYEYCRAYWPDSAERSVPEFYADYDYYHWLIVPTPDAAYPWEISVYQQPALLDDVNQTNWLTDYMPNALLYRSLVESEPFLKEDERINIWRELYQERIGAVNVQDLKKIVDRSTARTEA
jgi:hypothetical protein